jgi:thiol-disulfide isomerase/thioredoxin
MRIPSLKSWLIFGAGFASCIVCLVPLMFGAYHILLKPLLQETSPPEFFTPQAAAFDIAAVGSNSTTLHFQDLRGRVVVLNIWATWCAPCMAELPSLGRLAAHYSADKEVAVICLSAEPAASVLKSRGAQESHAPIYSLTSPQLPSVYKCIAIPATFVIDRQGNIVAKRIGEVDWSAPAVIAYIDSLRQRPNTVLEPMPTAP